MLQSLKGLSSQAEKIERACAKIAKADPKNIGAWKRAGRAALVKWNSERKDTRPDKLRLSEAEKYFNNAYENDKHRGTDSADPQAAFYKFFMLDFEELVNTEPPRCEKAVVRYGRALELYDKQKNSQDGDFFILTELGHFLINRDKNYERAIKVFEKISGNEKGYTQHILMSKAIAHALEARRIANQSPNEAKKHLEKTKGLLESSRNSTETYKFKFYLATNYVQVASQERELSSKIQKYEEAHQLYEDVVSEGFANKFYLAQRNLSLVSFLLGNYKEQQNLPNEAEKFYRQANDDLNKIFRYGFLEDKPFEQSETNRIEIKGNVDFILNDYRRSIELCSSGARCLTQGIKSFEKRVVDIISSNSYYLLHEGTIDPFFDVEHGKSYCEAVTTRS